MSAAHGRRVLFVCVENSCRSQMAEAFARHHGGEDVEARSAGSRPSGTVHPMAVSVMAARGLDLSDQRSTGVEDLERAVFEVVVSMGCGDACPEVSARRRVEWEIADPAGGDRSAFERARDEIELRVRELLENLG